MMLPMGLMIPVLRLCQATSTRLPRVAPARQRKTARWRRAIQA